MNALRNTRGILFALLTASATLAIVAGPLTPWPYPPSSKVAAGPLTPWPYPPSTKLAAGPLTPWPYPPSATIS